MPIFSVTLCEAAFVGSAVLIIRYISRPSNP